VTEQSLCRRLALPFTKKNRIRPAPVCVFTQTVAANWGTLRRVGMIDGESLGFWDDVSLAHGLLFFIADDCSSVIRHEPGNIDFQSNEEDQK
jgi:hypothetical protein